MYKKYPNIFLIVISILLIIIPFFWLKPGQLDLGGDASRIYFYDPLTYLTNFSFYFVVPQGIGLVEPNFFSLPFLVFLFFLNQITQSPHLTITVFNSFKLVTAFLSIYFIIKAIMKISKTDNTQQSYAAILAGVFYVLTPTMTGNWDRALLSHNQVFINPLIFLLLLKSITTKEDKYIWFLLLVSFIFSNNFAYTSAPAFFAFFPIAFLFLFLLMKLYKITIPYRKLSFGFILFLGLQAFHIVPQIISLLDPNSYTYSRVFNKEEIVNEGVRYFTTILSLAKVSNYILLTYGSKEQLITTCIPFGVMLIGFITAKKLKKLLVLIGLFYLVTLLLLSANITQLWVKIYESLFYLPGFSMFRNFIGQWLFVFSFFNTLFFGFALVSIFQVLNKKFHKILFLGISFILVITSWKFISGEYVNRILFQNSKSTISHKIDDNFIDTINFIKSLQASDKFLTLPLTDAYYHVVPGKDNGVYIGPSLVAYLGGKKDFAGHQVFNQFGDDFLHLVKEKKYSELKKLFSILNIKYIFHNNSKHILDNNNEGFLYSNVGNYLPSTQAEYTEMIRKLDVRLIYKKGTYRIYEVPNVAPHIYSPKKVYEDKLESSVSGVLSSISNDTFILVSRDECKKSKINCNTTYANIPTLKTTLINPTLYTIDVSNAKEPYLLVHSNAYHTTWTLKSNNKELENAYHFIANRYANAWEIRPEDVNYNKNYRLTLQLEVQKYFYLSLLISILSFLVLLLWGVILIRKSWYNKLQRV